MSTNIKTIRVASPCELENVRLFHLDQLDLMPVANAKSLSDLFFYSFCWLFFAWFLQSVEFCAFLSQFKRVFFEDDDDENREFQRQTELDSTIFIDMALCVCVRVTSSITCCSTQTKSNSKPLTLCSQLVYCHKSCVCFNWLQFISIRCVSLFFSLCLLSIKIAVIFSFDFSSIHLIWALVFVIMLFFFWFLLIFWTYRNDNMCLVNLCQCRFSRLVIAMIAAHKYGAAPVLAIIIPCTQFSIWLPSHLCARSPG